MIRYRDTDTTIVIDNIKSHEFKQTKRTLQKGHYFIYEVTSKDRLNNLSNKFYNNPLYWFVIAQVNPEIDVFQLEEGYPLKVVHPEYLRYYV